MNAENEQKSADQETLARAALRGLGLGARFGAIIWCVVLFAAAVIYFAVQTYGWVALGRLPDPPPQTLDDWLGAAAGILISLTLVAVYGAIAGAGVTFAAAISRRLRAARQSRTP